MLPKKSMPVSLTILSLISLGVLLFTGFSPIGAERLTRQLQQGPMILDVSPIRQYLGTSCGEAAIAMTYNYAYPQSPVNELEIIEYATDQGYYTEEIVPFTSPANMVKIARHYADDVSSGRVLNSDQGLSLLFDRLQRDEPVIIDVLTYLNDPGSDAHFVVVTGLSVDANGENVIIHYNNPLTGKNESAVWTGEAGIWHAWQNNSDPGGSGWWLTMAPAR